MATVHAQRRSIDEPPPSLLILPPRHDPSLPPRHDHTPPSRRRPAQVHFLHQEALLAALSDVISRAVHSTSHTRTFTCATLDPFTGEIIADVRGEGASSSSDARGGDGGGDADAGEEQGGSKNPRKRSAAAAALGGVAGGASSANARQQERLASRNDTKVDQRSRKQWCPGPLALPKACSKEDPHRGITQTRDCRSLPFQPRNDAKLARVNHTLQRIDDFMVPHVPGGAAAATATQSLSASEPSQRSATAPGGGGGDGDGDGAQRASVETEEDADNNANDPELRAGDGGRSGGGDGGSSGARKRAPPEFEETTCSYVSVRSLVRDIKDREHRGLAQLLREHHFVGVVDDMFSLVQHNTRLLLVNHAALAHELFYQVILPSSSAAESVV